MFNIKDDQNLAIVIHVKKDVLLSPAVHLLLDEVLNNLGNFIEIDFYLKKITYKSDFSG